MIAGKSFLGIITARGGSKGLPGKNLRPLAGKPLLTWTMEAAKAAQCLDEIMVTTDSEEIARVAREFGVNVPFIRPAELATDEALSNDVVYHALKYYEDQLQRSLDYFILLQPTSPLRTAPDIDNAAAYLMEKQARAVISVSVEEHNPAMRGELPEDMSLHGFIKHELKNTRRQAMPTQYQINGAIYIGETQLFLQDRDLTPDVSSYAYEMEQRRSIDIDSQLDFDIAECLLKSQSSN